MERFLGKIIKTNYCWVWKGVKTSKGYGYLRINKKKIKAHRYSYEFFIKPIPKDKIIMHLCDNRSCVNPKHLKVGTIKENNKDMANKGRSRNRYTKK